MSEPATARSWPWTATIALLEKLHSMARQIAISEAEKAGPNGTGCVRPNTPA